MFNPFIILYFLLVGFYLLSVVVVTYHLLKYQLNSRVTFATTALFLLGAFIILLINIAFALTIPWSEFSIIL